MPDLVMIPMDVEMPGFEELVRLRDRGEPYWWLWAGQCPFCGEQWLVAQEERANDVVVMRRLSHVETRGILQDGVWPDDFDRYEAVIEASAQIQQFRYLNPVEQLRDFVDLANERPGISVDDLARLLNIDYPVALELALRAVDEFDVNIEIPA